MRVVIYGAGAIGGVVGGHLARAGHDVILIGRPGHVKAIQEHGLRLITPTDTHILQVPAVTAPGHIDFGPDDVVFLCTKGQSTEEALRDLRAVVEDVPVFCFQNGVRNEEIAAQYFPKVYGVKVLVGAVYLTDGEVVARRDPPGWLIVGCYPTGTDDLAETVGTKLRAADFFTKVTPDVMPYKWGKLMRNLANAIGAITNATGDDIRVIARAAWQEGRDILSQAGIRWVSDEELALEWPDSTTQPRSSLSIRAQSSTWQSLERRQGSVEADFLNGEVVRLAKKVGGRAPVNEGLLRISQEMAANRETPGKYTPAQLSVLLGLAHP
ncbi:MAG: 2-dehydropantoate 2-reductase [Dehalococcoidia bacterium]